MNWKSTIFILGFVGVVAAALAGIFRDEIQQAVQPKAIEPDPGENLFSARSDRESSLGESLYDWGKPTARTDEQGVVTFEVTPVDFGSNDGVITFRVAMNTHSVDLNMDLSALAVLETDAGFTVEAVGWDGPLGGHHVTGLLSFPSSLDGTPILEGSSVITLTILDVDAPSRVFTWEK